MERIMNEENDWNHDMDENAVDGPVNVVTGDVVVHAFNV